MPSRHLHPLFRDNQIRAIEQAALARLPDGTLMERAGHAAGALVQRVLGSVSRKKILVLAGPGNNGGDALIAGAWLAKLGAQVHVLPHLCNEACLPADASRALSVGRASGAQFLDTFPGNTDWHLVIDGLFGIGLARSFAPSTRELVAQINTLRCPVVALDIPSGLNPDTGALIDEEGCAIVASHTITFIADKPGLHTNYGRDYAGKVTVADLGIDTELIALPEIFLNAPQAFSSTASARAHNSHKGSHGDVCIIGAASGMTGASILAGRTAAYAGAGKVHVAMLEQLASYDTGCPELMLRSVASEFPRGAIFAIGPGLGRSKLAKATLVRSLNSNQAIVIDADAINLIAEDSSLRDALCQRTSPAVLTPHPLEAARLLNCDVATVQSDRIASAKQIASELGCICLLKGSGSILARQDGMILINPTGNAALATAGTGDVLTGLCAALLAQGAPAWEAAAASAWTHGAAADAWVEKNSGVIGMTASELIDEIRRIRNRLVSGQRRLLR